MVEPIDSVASQESEFDLPMPSADGHSRSSESSDLVSEKHEIHRNGTSHTVDPPRSANAMENPMSGSDMDESEG